jgi:hypothetical protein
MTTTQASDNMTGLRGDINREAASRVWDVGGALRVHLNNMSLSGLREYIALSRHQFELTEFVCERTGQSGQSGAGDDGPESVPVMNYALGRHELVPFKRRGIEAMPPTPGWGLEMLDDMAWRARAIGAVLKRLGPQIPVRTVDDHAELSRHQCKIVDFMTTGSFRKVPKRRKARMLSGGAVTPGSEERIKLLGEALQEYQGRIEIKTVHEFIALSKHQCELAGLLFASVSGEGKEPVFEVVHYTDAYENAVGSSGPVGKRPRERGESASPGVPFCDTFGHAKVSEETPDRSGNGPYIEKNEAVNVPPLPSNCDIYYGHIIERYGDGGALVRADIPGYPRKFRITKNFVPPGGGPVPLFIKRQEPKLFRGGYDENEYWDDDP